MWQLAPAQIIVAFGLDLILGDPRWMPNLRKLVLWLGRRLQRRAAGDERSNLVIWLLVCGALLGGFAALFFLFSIFKPLAWLLEVFVFYQCFAAMQLHRQVWTIIKRLSTGDDSAARLALHRLRENDDAQPAAESERSASQQTIAAVGRSAFTGLVAPLFWGALLGVPGALLYRVTHTLHHLGPETGRRGATFSSRADWLLGWIPARLVAILSEVFREFRHFGKVTREARRHPDPNEGWGEAAVAYAVDVRLDAEPNPAGVGINVPAFNEAGAEANVLHVTQALFWFWKVTALAVVLAVLTTF